MRVKEIMTPRLTSVAPSVGADEAWDLMKGDRIHHLVVMDGKRIAGVLSSGDAGRSRGKAIRQGLRVADLMTESVVTIGADAPLKRAANLMRGRNIGCLVVVERGKPVGIVTTSDLLELLGRGALRPVPVGRRPNLSHRAPHRKRNRAYGAW
jgi:acetoin utilization protein AcuB